MHLDVRDLKDFYYRSALYREVQKVIRTEVRFTWPNTHGHTVAGYGFAAPLLRPFLSDSRRVVALMPAPQGVISWPAGLPNVSVLCEETRWPLETGHVDRLVVMHGLETSDDASALLDECYRVLGPGGEALFIVPNRTGLWARSDRTPFGYGRPYSLSQLREPSLLARFRAGRSRLAALPAALYPAILDEDRRDVGADGPRHSGGDGGRCHGGACGQAASSASARHARTGARAPWRAGAQTVGKAGLTAIGAGQIAGIVSKG